MGLTDYFLPKMRDLGVGVVRDVRYVTDPLIHSLEQPLSNLYTDAKTVATDLWSISQVTVRIAAYWLGGWLLYSFVGSLFPREKRMLEDTVYRAWKRVRM